MSNTTRRIIVDNGVLKKRLNTFKSKAGKLRKISDEVIIEVLRAWENWPGTTADPYRDLGLSKMQLVTILKKAKYLIKNGVVQESEFKEITLDGDESIQSDRNIISMNWDQGKVINFPTVDHLVDFLKKVA